MRVVGKVGGAVAIFLQIIFKLIRGLGFIHHSFALFMLSRKDFCRGSNN